MTVLTQNANMWDKQLDNHVRVVTTNGVLQANGDLVMGKGIALQFKQRYPWLPILLGAYVKENGNHCYYAETKDGQFICSFPTKHHWKDKSDILLIEQSAHEIVELADKHSWTHIVMSPPGCGLGGLSWPEVKYVIERILDDRFTILVKE